MGKLSLSCGWVEGDVLWPLPNRAGIMMKYLDGLSEVRASDSTDAVSWMTTFNVVNGRHQSISKKLLCTNIPCKKRKLTYKQCKTSDE